MVEAAMPMMGVGSLGLRPGLSSGGCDMNSNNISIGSIAAEKLEKSKAISSLATDLRTYNGEFNPLDLSIISQVNLKISRGKVIKNMLTGDEEVVDTLLSEQGKPAETFIWEGDTQGNVYSEVLDKYRKVASSQTNIAAVWVSYLPETDKNRGSNNRIYKLEKKGNEVVLTSYTTGGSENSMWNFLDNISEKKHDHSTRLHSQTAFFSPLGDVGHEKVYSALTESLTRNEKIKSNRFLEKFREELHISDKEREKINRSKDERYAQMLKDEMAKDKSIQSAFGLVAQGVAELVDNARRRVHQSNNASVVIRKRSPYAYIGEYVDVKKDNTSHQRQDSRAFDVLAAWYRKKLEEDNQNQTIIEKPQVIGRKKKIQLHEQKVPDPSIGKKENASTESEGKRKSNNLEPVVPAVIALLQALTETTQTEDVDQSVVNFTENGIQFGQVTQTEVLDGQIEPTVQHKPILLDKLSNDTRIVDLSTEEKRILKQEVQVQIIEPLVPVIIGVLHHISEIGIQEEFESLQQGDAQKSDKDVLVSIIAFILTAENPSVSPDQRDDRTSITSPPVFETTKDGIYQDTVKQEQLKEVEEVITPIISLIVGLNNLIITTLHAVDNEDDEHMEDAKEKEASFTLQGETVIPFTWEQIIALIYKTPRELSPSRYQEEKINEVSKVELLEISILVETDDTINQFIEQKTEETILDIFDTFSTELVHVGHFSEGDNKQLEIGDIVVQSEVIDQIREVYISQFQYIMEFFGEPDSVVSSKKETVILDDSGKRVSETSTLLFPSNEIVKAGKTVLQILLQESLQQKDLDHVDGIVHNEVIKATGLQEAKILKNKEVQLDKVTTEESSKRFSVYISLYEDEKTREELKPILAALLIQEMQEIHFHEGNNELGEIIGSQEEELLLKQLEPFIERINKYFESIQSSFDPLDIQDEHFCMEFFKRVCYLLTISKSAQYLSTFQGKKCSTQDDFSEKILQKYPEHYYYSDEYGYLMERNKLTMLNAGFHQLLVLPMYGVIYQYSNQLLYR